MQRPKNNKNCRKNTRKENFPSEIVEKTAKILGKKVFLMKMKIFSENLKKL